MADRAIGQRRIVAIDGPSGVGKTTVSRRLAQRLGVPVLDTGAMYRAVALDVLERGVDPRDREAVVRLAAVAAVDVVAKGNRVQVRLAGQDVEPRIRTPEVSEATSQISTYPEVRRRLVELQRETGKRLGAVVEGRDIGSVVFPDTTHKFFLEARSEIRAERRHRELAAAYSLEKVRRDLERRDARDREREDSPLTHDESYEVVDTSELTPDEIVDRMVRAIERHEKRDNMRA